MGRLSGKVAIITGASSGIGAAIAEGFAQEGASVVLAARRAEALAGIAAGITAAGGSAITQQTDVTREDHIEALFRLVDDRFGRLDILVNSAGIADHTPTEKLSAARWHEIIDTNLTSAFLCCRAAMIRMKSQKRGRIINIGSISAKTPRPHTIGYTASKFAMEGLTRSLALDGRADGINVSILHPGSTVSGLVPDMAARPRSQSMAAADIAAIATLMACLPDETNLLEALAFPIDQPFLGRG